MNYPFKSKGIRSWAALIAAYAIVLHSVLGGIALGQQASLANNNSVICYGSGASTQDEQPGKLSLRHIPCALCVAGAGAPPRETAALPLPAIRNSAAIIFTPNDAPYFKRHISPRLSQGPPQTV